MLKVQYVIISIADKLNKLSTECELFDLYIYCVAEKDVDTETPKVP